MKTYIDIVKKERADSPEITFHILRMLHTLPSIMIMKSHRRNKIVVRKIIRKIVRFLTMTKMRKIKVRMRAKQLNKIGAKQMNKM